MEDMRVYRYGSGPGGVRTHSQVNWDLVVKCASEVPVKNWLTILSTV